MFHLEVHKVQGPLHDAALELVAGGNLGPKPKTLHGDCPKFQLIWGPIFRFLL